MTAAHSQTLPIPETPVAPVKVKDQKASRAFRDNIEHLEALEYAARLKVAIAYLRDRNISQQSAKPEDCLSQQARKKGIFGEPDFNFQRLSSEDITLRELKSSLNRVETETGQRVQNALGQGVELHFESFCISYELDEFERTVVSLLIANNTARSFRDLYEQCQLDPQEPNDGGMSIGAILSILYNEYRDQITNRKYFSIDASLIKHEIIIPWLKYDDTTNILDMVVHLHERIIRYVLGDNNVYDTDFQCISREKITVRLDQVILPENVKEEVFKLAHNYSRNRSWKEKALIDEFYGYGTGLTFLFHGPSGTGKTMLAHALANGLNKELLTVDFAKAEQLNASTEDIIKYIFKETKLCNGIVFFDECDDVFHVNSRDSRTLLIEIEKTECITILASNKVIELDPALDRRVTMKVPFRLPDETQRERIWKALVPPNIILGKDIDFGKLARNYVFTGGLIKNALFMAITNAMNKNANSKVTLTSGEIEKAANHQSASMFDLNGFGETYFPKSSIKGLPLRHRDKEMIHKLAPAYKKFNANEPGMRFAIGCSHIQTGIDCVDAVARECKLRVRRFRMSDLLYGSGTSKEIRDPFTQKEMSAMDYAFRTSTGHKSLTLLVDHGSVFKQLLMEDQEDWKKELLGFFEKLEKYKGMVFLVTTPIKQHRLPVEFNHYMEIHLPPEELQIRQWEKYLKNGKKIEYKIIRLVERHPLHLHEIDIIANQAHMSAFLDGNGGMITIDHVHDAVKRFENRRNSPMLFGDNWVNINHINNAL